MVSDLKTFTYKGCKIAAQKKSLFWGKFCNDQEVIQQWSGGYTTMIRRLYNNDQKVIQQGLGCYKTRIKRVCFLTQLQSLSIKRLLIKVVKSLRKKGFVFCEFCFTSMIFFSIGATIRISRDMLCLSYTGFLN